MNLWPLSVTTTVDLIPGFGCNYRVTRRSWRSFGFLLWESCHTERNP